MIPEARNQIVAYLIQENYLNEERFAQSFARGKFNIKKWGRNRITNELKLRQISKYNIKTALKEIEDEDYLNTLHILAKKRLTAIKETNKQKRRKNWPIIYSIAVGKVIWCTANLKSRFRNINAKYLRLHNTI